MVKRYSYYGKEYKISELCQIAKEKYNQDISASALTKRLRRMPVKQALQLPVRKQQTLSKQYDLDQLQKQAWDHYGLKLSKAAIAQRLQRSWTIEKAISTPLQSNRSLKTYQYQGQLLTLDQLAELSHQQGMTIPKNILRARLGLGWDVHRAISTPLTRNARYWYHGHNYTIDELVTVAIHHGNFINQTALLRRLGRGWPIEKAVEQPMRKRQKSEKEN